jgi:hypothetical protein
MQETPTLDPPKERETRAGRVYSDLPQWVARISMPIVLTRWFVLHFWPRLLAGADLWAHSAYLNYIFL